MLQSAMLDEGGGDGVYNRIVKFDTATGRAVAQYAYRMEGASQGRGISALVALNDHEFLVLERNNRGLGVDAELTPPEQEGVPHRPRPAPPTCPRSTSTRRAPSFTPVAKQPTPWLDLARPPRSAIPRWPR